MDFLFVRRTLDGPWSFPLSLLPANEALREDKDDSDSSRKVSERARIWEIEPVSNSCFIANSRLADVETGLLATEDRGDIQPGTDASLPFKTPSRYAGVDWGASELVLVDDATPLFAGSTAEGVFLSSCCSDRDGDWSFIVDSGSFADGSPRKGVVRALGNAEGSEGGYHWSNEGTTAGSSLVRPVSSRGRTKRWSPRAAFRREATVPSSRLRAGTVLCLVGDSKAGSLRREDSRGAVDARIS